MRISKKSNCCGGILAQIGLGIALLCGQNSQAASLPPGGLLFGVPPEPDPVNASVLFSTNVAWSSLSIAGYLTSTVWTGDTSNPLGGLTFSYQLTVTTGTVAATQVAVDGFAGLFTDVSYQFPPTGNIPTTATRSLINGDTIKFLFQGATGVNAGQSSAVLVIQTDALGYGFDFGSVQSTGSSVNVSIVSPVPEPTSMALLSLGLAALVVSRRRLQKNKTA